MKTKIRDEARAAAVRLEWTQALNTLIADITRWSESEGWSVRAFERVFNEDSTGEYLSPDLVIQTPHEDQLKLEVIGRGPELASGRVQFSAWPTLFRVTLMRKPGSDTWVIRTDSGIPIRQPWNRETFITLANDLLRADQ